MANQRGTFAKRQRETDLKDKARQKEARRAAKRDEQKTTKGPQIDWSQPGGVTAESTAPLPGAGPSTNIPVPTDDTASPGDDKPDTDNE